MTEPRRVRTQAERDADGLAWRAVADSRPGYATWPQTAPGDPSWWRREAPTGGIVHSTVDADNPGMLGGCGFSDVARVFVVDGPPPVDGETCPKWCGFCHLNTGQPAPVADAAAAVGRVLGEHLPAIGEALTNLPPRRRWWHRLTRRAL